MAFEKVTNSIHELNDNIRAFVESNAEYYKLTLYKQVVKGTISLVNALLIGFIGLFALVFLSIAVAIKISTALDNPSSGYFIVAGFYVLMLVFVLLFGRKSIERNILKKTSRKFFNDQKPPDERI